MIFRARFPCPSQNPSLLPPLAMMGRRGIAVMLLGGCVLATAMVTHMTPAQVNTVPRVL